MWIPVRPNNGSLYMFYSENVMWNRESHYLSIKQEFVNYWPIVVYCCHWRCESTSYKYFIHAHRQYNENDYAFLTTVVFIKLYIWRMTGYYFWHLWILIKQKYIKGKVFRWFWNLPPVLWLCIALFAVAEGWLLLDIGWFVLFQKSIHLRFISTYF